MDILSRTSNREALRGSLAEWTNRHLRATGGDRTVRHATIDIDSFAEAFGPTGVQKSRRGPTTARC